MKTVEVTAVVNEARYFGLPLGITILTIFIMLVDGFDLQTMSFVAPELVNDWGVSRAMLAPVLTGSMIGMAIGSILLGWLGDQIGRKRSYVVCIAFLFVGSLLSASVHDLTNLFFWRVLTGIGLGGVTPLATTMISEWTPKHARSVAVACAIVAVPLGGMLGAGVAQWIIPAYGWRMIFNIGAMFPLVFFVIAMWLLPESPRYLAQRPRRAAELARALNRLLREKRYDGTESFHIEEPPAPPGNWLKILLRPPYRGTTLLLWVAFTTNTLALYAFVNWLPTIITSIGLSRQAGLEASKFFNFGGFFGAVGGAALIGLMGSRLVSGTLASVGALVTVAIGLALTGSLGLPQGLLLFALLIAGAAMNGMQSFIYTVGANSYPTSVRASGLGCAQTVSRIGGVLSNVVGGAYFAMKPLPPISLFFFVVAGVILVVIVSFTSMRTHISSRRVAAGQQTAGAL